MKRLVEMIEENEKLDEQGGRIYSAFICGGNDEFMCAKTDIEKVKMIYLKEENIDFITSFFATFGKRENLWAKIIAYAPKIADVTEVRYVHNSRISPFDRRECTADVRYYQILSHP